MKRVPPSDPLDLGRGAGPGIPPGPDPEPPIANTRFFGVRVWKVLLGVERGVVVEDVVVADSDGERVLVASVRCSRRASLRCPHCRRRCPGYDRGGGRRRWRGLDLGSTRVFLEAEAPRVACARHGVVVAGVPWARHGSAFTAVFEDQCAWLAAHMAASTVAELMRSSWRAVTGMITRVVGEARGRTDRLAGVTKIAIDEKAYRKGHRYLTVVTDLDTGRVIWAAEGRCQATVEAFFTALGPERAARLTHVGCDGADWIHPVVRAKAPNAVICLDSFHVVAWAGEAVEEVRRRVGRDLLAAGREEEAAALKGSRWVVLKNPKNLTGGQQESLAVIKKANAPLCSAYLIKEQLREVFAVKGRRGRLLLAGVISWATHSKIPEMVDLARKLRRFRDLITNTLASGVTSALAENTNMHITVLARRAYGFHSPEALIAMIELTRGGLCPPLPGRAT